MLKAKNVFKSFMLSLLLLFFAVAVSKVGTYAAEDPCKHTGHEEWTELSVDDFSRTITSTEKFYLKNDLTLDATHKQMIIAEGADVTICLDGHKITLNEESPDPMFLLKMGSFAICDCSAQHAGKIISKSCVVNFDSDVAARKFVLDSGSIEAAGTTQTSAIYLCSGESEGSTFEMRGGSVKSNGDTVYLECLDKVRITGGEIETSSESDRALFIGSVPEASVSNAKISAENYTALRASGCDKVTISDSNITGLEQAVYSCRVKELKICKGNYTGEKEGIYLYGDLDCSVIIENATVTGGDYGIFSDEVITTVKGGKISSLNSYSTDNMRPSYPIMLKYGFLTLEGTTEIVPSGNYPQVYISDSAYLDIPTTLPKKAFSVYCDTINNPTVFIKCSKEDTSAVDVFKSRFPGKKITDYVSVVSSFATGTETKNEYAYGSRMVSKQPTLESPTMEVAEEGNTSYQWYDVNVSEDTLSNTNVEVNDAEYENNAWKLYYNDIAFTFNQTHDYAEVEIKVIDLREPSSSLREGLQRTESFAFVPKVNGQDSGLRGVAHNEEVFYASTPVTGKGVYTIQLPAKGTYYFKNLVRKLAKAEITVKYYDINSEEKGQTSKTLTSFTRGYKACVATFDLGKAYKKAETYNGSLRGDMSADYESVDVVAKLISQPVFINTVPVKFESNGGSKIASVNVTPGNLLKKPADPKLSGLEFVGWYKDENLKTAWNFSKDKVEGSVTLYAKWDVSDEQFAKNTAEILEGYRLTRSKSAAKVTWGKVKKADEYGVFIGYCGPKFGKNPTTTVKATTKSLKKSYSKINGKKFDTKKAAKAQVAAYQIAGNQKIKIAETPVGHCVSSSDKTATNVKSLKLEKTKITLKKGKSTTIKATATKQNVKKAFPTENHGALYRYHSSNPSVVKVTGKGKITAKKKGTAYVYVIVNDGMNKKVKVTVN